ncbi:MAG: RdgB/HAM1 family non-canonical purine NTP pyrophosphatase [Planctomycetaceae bacterium]|nr:RdgB/HAM1 family non-canonical purine NTP pyrophosphatase [Planctomycetales bacterium]MCB9927136.1 RdgB/HAM1 family non-canonical purine NTP pyrophosphatase [Planctomycetaceae bacterium]
MDYKRILVLGTHNKKKGVELAELLEPYGFALRTLADVSHAIEVEETGTTFAENARLKATVQAKHLNCWVLGEDSGLSVDALDGGPGVYSARYSGANATDESNNAKLLAKLAELPLERRTAHYTCHAVLSDPLGVVRAEAEDYCRGRILFERSGSGGFGYDPLFEIPEYHRTFGELGSSVKTVLSHRSRAMRAIIPQIVLLGASDVWDATQGSN